MKTLLQSEQAQFLTKNVTCSIVRESGEKITGTVEDICLNGIGIVLSCEIETGSKISIFIKHRTQVAQMMGVVKYCHEHNDAIGCLRVGCNLLPLERINSRIWQSWCEMVQDIAA
jgi:Na+-transporting methylmalonyl-CoA/oxaloacetate decarboxylase beta subunit